MDGERHHLQLQIPDVSDDEYDNTPLYPPHDDNATEIHEAFNNTIDIESFVHYLSNNVQQQYTNDINFPQFIQSTLHRMIIHNPESSQTNLEHLENIMRNRLFLLDYSSLSPNLLRLFYYCLEFASEQPKFFQTAYVNFFLSDCINAYAGDDITCAHGALERLVFSLEAAATVCISTGADYVDRCQSLLELFKSPQIIIDESIQDWFKLHNKNSENAFDPNMSAEDMRDNLYEYLVQKFEHPTQTIFGLINDGIKKYETLFEHDYFQYGGRTKKYRVNKKTKCVRKNRKKTCRRLKRRSSRALKKRKTRINA